MFVHFFCAPSTWPWVYDSFPKRKHEAKQHQSTGLKQHPQCFPFNKCGFVWGDLLLSMNHFSFKPTKITSWGHFLIYSTYFSTLFLLANPNNQIDRGWQHPWLWFFSWWFHACVASNRCKTTDVYVDVGKTFKKCVQLIWMVKTFCFVKVLSLILNDLEKLYRFLNGVKPLSMWHMCQQIDI